MNYRELKRCSPQYRKIGDRLRFLKFNPKNVNYSRLFLLLFAFCYHVVRKVSLFPTLVCFLWRINAHVIPYMVFLDVQVFKLRNTAGKQVS